MKESNLIYSVLIDGESEKIQGIKLFNFPLDIFEKLTSVWEKAFENNNYTEDFKAYMTNFFSEDISFWWENINQEDFMKKREDYLTWDEYFMGIALLSAKRSKDPSTQVGACIVNKHKKSCWLRI